MPELLNVKAKEDCDMLGICEQIHDGSVYKLCYKDGNSMNRCNPSEKTIIMALAKINEKLDSAK